MTPKRTLLIALGLLTTAAPPLFAGITGYNPIDLSFSGKSNAGCTLSKDTKCTDGGIVLQPSGKGWLETSVFTVGLAYRASCSVTVFFNVEVAEKEIPEKIAPLLRYSCDRVHWSDWAPVAGGSHMQVQPKPMHIMDVRASKKDCETFDALTKELGKPEEGKVWGTDAYFRWVAAHKPEIFARAIPVVGYIQLKFVNNDTKPITLKKIDGQIPWYVSGLSREGEPVDFSTPWRFDLRPSTTQSTTQPTSQPATPRTDSREVDRHPQSSTIPKG